MSNQSRKRHFPQEAPFSLTSSFDYDIIPLSNKGKSSKAVSTSDKKEVRRMRKDFILFLSFLVDAGYIMAFRVTKDKIFITIRK